MRLGLGLGLRKVGGFNPAALFGTSTGGALYDPSDISSMFQDSAGTTPAVVDSPVGRIKDKSGRGNHAVQATASAMPILRRDSGGRLYLEFDGVDDCLRATFAISQPWDRVSAVRQLGWTSLDRIFSGASSTAGSLTQSGSSPQLALFSGSTLAVSGSAIGANAVMTERHDGGSGRFALNGEAYTTGAVGSTATDGISIGDVGTSAGVVRAANMRLYGVCMIGRALADVETARLRAFMATKAGVSL